MDTLHFDRCAGAAPAYAASVRVKADGARKAWLWLGVSGKVTASLNGQKVMEEESVTRYRIGQFQKEVELRPGENLLVFEVRPARAAAQLSVQLVGQRNDGDSVDGIAWSA